MMMMNIIIKDTFVLLAYKSFSVSARRWDVTVPLEPSGSGLWCYRDAVRRFLSIKKKSSCIKSSWRPTSKGVMRVCFLFPDQSIKVQKKKKIKEKTYHARTHAFAVLEGSNCWFVLARDGWMMHGGWNARAGVRRERDTAYICVCARARARVCVW